MKTLLSLNRTIFAACVLASVNTIQIYAQHPLDSWARRAVPGLTTNLSSVAYGNGVFVAVGDGSTVVTSPNGTIWAVSTAGAYGNLARIRFINGEFVAVGTSDKILFSADGATWTARTLPTADCWDVAYGNGVYVVAGSTSHVSSDGVNWTMSRGPLDSVAFGNGRFVALPTTLSITALTPPRTVHSTNGVDWVEDFQPSYIAAQGTGEVIHGDGLFVGEASQWNGVMTTTDGTDWCCRFKGGVAPEVLNGGLAHGRGYFVWAGVGTFDTSNRPFIYSSTNGVSWQTRFAPSSFPGATDPTLKGTARGAAFGNDTFVFVGDGGFILQSGNLGGAPLIITQPQDRAAILDNPASFSVQASGSQPLAYQWFHNNTAITNATNSTHSIAHVQTSDNGGYQVLITNSFGSATSRVAQLSVAFLDIAAYAGIKLLGVPGRTYRIEASPASGPLNWQTLTNIVLLSSPYVWIDYDSPQVGQRLYRAAELP